MAVSNVHGAPKMGMGPSYAPHKKNDFKSLLPPENLRVRLKCHRRKESHEIKLDRSFIHLGDIFIDRMWIGTSGAARRDSADLFGDSPGIVERSHWQND